MSTSRYTAEQEAVAAALGVPLGRVRYADAGAAQRAACERANEAADLFTCSDWRLLLAVLGLTCSYSRLADTVSVGQLVERSGLSDRQVRRSLGRLRDAGVIVHVAGRGRGRLTVVGVPEADGKAAQPSSSFLDSESGHDAVRFADEEKGTGSTPKSGHGDPGKEDCYARAVLTEKESEKKPSPRTTTDLPEELERLLRNFDLRQSQRTAMLAAFRESPDGLARCVQEAVGGGCPEGLLTELVREGKHRKPGEDTLADVLALFDLIDGCDSASPTLEPDEDNRVSDAEIAHYRAVLAMPEPPPEWLEPVE